MRVVSGHTQIQLGKLTMGDTFRYGGMRVMQSDSTLISVRLTTGVAVSMRDELIAQPITGAFVEGKT